MRVAVTARGRNIDDQVDPRFGRSPYFLVVDTDTLETEAVANPNLDLSSGAGIQSAELMAERGVSAVLTGNCGPNAYRTLEAADIQVVVGANGSVRNAVMQFRSGALSTTRGPNVPSHSGLAMDRQSTPSEGSPQLSPPPPGYGPSSASRMARRTGMGGGREPGRASGQVVSGVFPAPRAGDADVSPPPPASGTELDDLRARAKDLESQLDAVNDRLAALNGRTTAPGGLVAEVNGRACNGCARCERVCPVRAISVTAVAVIDAARCTGCGDCVRECLRRAIVMTSR